ncbi:MAG: translation initiation factor IF-2 [Alphaproteobacteria bacterium]|nr:translation initiation factor IF-2 [Alphaproteobacteria bacterium]
MTENQNEKKSVLSLSGKGQLGLKKSVDLTSQTRGTKGRNAVTVEVKRKRFTPHKEEQPVIQEPQPVQVEAPKVEITQVEVSKTEPVKTEAPKSAPPRMAPTRTEPPKTEGKTEAPRYETRTDRPLQQRKPLHEQKKLSAASLRGLSDDERAHRLRLLQESIRAEERQMQYDLENERRTDDEARASEEKKRRLHDEQLKKIAEERKAAEEQALKDAQEAEKAKQAKAPEKKASGQQTPTTPSADADAKKTDSKDDREKTGKTVKTRDFDEDENAARGRVKKVAEKVEVKERYDPGAKRNLARTFTGPRSEEEENAARSRSMAAIRRSREKERKKLHGKAQEQVKIVREVIIPEVITVQELANRMAERSTAVIRELMKMGIMATINQAIDADTAELIVTELGHKTKRVSESDIEIGLEFEEMPDDILLSRAPVVTIMGHVDHGKTSLLDALRSTDVAAGEAGGITQHIGAYSVTLPSTKKITFIDTPGHAAFSEMRARGANVTDIVVLVVAADDGVKQQTIEAIHHAQAANVPIIVAINKIDVPGADPTRVGSELLQHGIYLESMGGEILSVEVSAKKRLNLDVLEETILLQAEMLDLKANPNRLAYGAVIEAKQEKGRGSVATVLIQKGTLRVGDPFIAGCEWGRVRALLDDKGRKIEKAGPSKPVEVLGLDATPVAGDDFMVVETEVRAREVAEFRKHRRREKEIAASARGSLEQMFSQIAAGERKDLPLIIKSDVHGSLEAIMTSLDKVSTDEVKARILHAAVGSINESDVALARASNAIVIGFNVRANPQARESAARDNIEIRYYSIIYNLIDDMKSILSGLLAPTLKEKFLGNAEIRQVFNITKVGKIAGCYVTDGIMKRGGKVRLLRDNVVIHEGALKTLKRFKDEVKEVREGFECGMAFENYNDIQEKDIIECFEVEEIARTL